jgi:hypothetical protein
MWGKPVRHFVVAGVSVVAAASLATGPALAADESSLAFQGPHTVKAGWAERIFAIGWTDDNHDELVVYQDPAACETTDAAQAKLPYTERISFKPLAQFRTPKANPFVLGVTVKHEAKGEHRVCGFLVGTASHTAGHTLRHASWTFTVT